MSLPTELSSLDIFHAMELIRVSKDQFKKIAEVNTVDGKLRAFDILLPPGLSDTEIHKKRLFYLGFCIWYQVMYNQMLSCGVSPGGKRESIRVSLVGGLIAGDEINRAYEKVRESDIFKDDLAKQKAEEEKKVVEEKTLQFNV